MATLISIPAGRCFRRSAEHKWVDPQAEKGLIELRYADDLMHLWWRSRENGNVQDELIVFPGEASFEKVTQDTSGRTHVLKFSSSNQKYFFWFQKASSTSDLRSMVDIHELLQDPTYRVGSKAVPEVAAESESPTASRDAPVAGPSQTEATSSEMQVETERVTPAPAAAAAAVGETSNQNVQEEMARLLVGWVRGGGMSNAADAEDAHLADIIASPQVLDRLTHSSALAEAITPLLPVSLRPASPAEDDGASLKAILRAPPFIEAMNSLESALRHGELPPSMMRDVGLPESAGQGMKQFLEALKGLHGGSQGEGDAGGDGPSDEHMDTD